MAQSTHMDGPGPRQPQERPGWAASTMATDALGYIMRMHIPLVQCTGHATAELRLCLPGSHTARQGRSFGLY